MTSPVPNLMVTRLTRYQGRLRRLGYFGVDEPDNGPNHAIIVAPICMGWDSESSFVNKGRLLMRRQITIKRRIRVPLEDLKRISEIKLKVETFVDKSK